MAKQEVFLRNVSSTGQAVDSYWVKITPGGDVAQFLFFEILRGYFASSSTMIILRKLHFTNTTQNNQD